jgi:hypothetical protein
VYEKGETKKKLGFITSWERLRDHRRSNTDQVPGRKWRAVESAGFKFKVLLHTSEQDNGGGQGDTI